MKTYTQREAFRMLAEGKKMCGVNWHNETYAKCNEDGLLVDQKGHRFTHLPMEIKWQEYTEPKWYDNIPEGGVLCRVYDKVHDKVTTPKFIRVVCKFANGASHGFIDANNSAWMAAEPITQEEIALFAANAPKGDEL